MKKLMVFTSIIVFYFSFNSFSQNQKELWGMTSSGGIKNGGVIFKTDANGDNQQVIHSFNNNTGANPNYTQLCQATNGKLYGMTQNGGSYNVGVIFEFDTVTNLMVRKFDFNGAVNGSNPSGSLIQASNGKLYGMTENGGANNMGVLFEFDLTTNTYTKKVDFAGAASGSYPLGSLVEAPNGKLYGMTSNGGTNNIGVLFEYDPATSTYTKKFNLTSGTGSRPNGSMVLAPNNKLYGVTYIGGTNNSGVIFEYNYTTSTYTKRMDFATTTTGSNPYGPLMLASNGKLYGMTLQGGTSSYGVIFEFDPTTFAFVKKFDFTGNATGYYTRGGLAQASNGNLYGMTYTGGVNGMGVLFEYNLSSSTYTKKIDFAGTSNGSTPYGTLLKVSTGKLYGMACYGGTNNMGVLFQYNSITSAFTKILDFDVSVNGNSPYGSLVKASNDKLYGLTYFGGANNNGILFEYDPYTNTFVKKLDFAGTTNGSYPRGSLVKASNGKLYGMTEKGGVNSLGALFEYDPTTSTYVKKLDFSGAANGESPCGSLIQASNGKLYGMTSSGGTGNLGVLFEYDYATSTYTKKIDFAGTTNGASPEGSLIQASNGKLYGMTRGGGSGSNGVLFEYDPATSTFTKKIDFTGSNGRWPFGTLIQASNGKLYGMTYFGGTSDFGIFFEYDPVTSSSIKLIDFSGTLNGKYPYGSLIQASNGKLYGMTEQGGANNLGALFEYDLTSGTYSKKLDFNTNNGKTPHYSNLIEICVLPKSDAVIPNVTICSGNNTNFIATATGNGLSYQWQVNTGSGFSDLINNAFYSDVTDDTLHITGAIFGMNSYNYRCVITSSCPVKTIQSDTAQLTVNPTYAFTENHSICEGETYTWHGTVYSIANTYTANYTSIKGCDSIYTLHLTVNPVYAFTENHSICNGEIYTWHGVNYTIANTYTASYTTIKGCDSIYTLNLSVKPTYAFTENHSICNGQTYTWHGTDYTTPNTYTASYTSILGCDSIYTLHLTINPNYAITENHSICEGETYHWQGVDYTTANTYTASYTSINGCDSIYTLNLTVNPVYAFNENHSICNGETYHWHGVDYTTANTYTASYNTIKGCDSIYTLQLTVNPSYSFADNHSMCAGETYHWRGADYTTSNTYNENYTTIKGCDSIYTLNLTVNPVYSFTDNHSFCEGEVYHWHGIDYTTANTYTLSYSSVSGCDSIYTLNLTLNSIDVSVNVVEPMITANAVGATYQWLDCNNMYLPILNETNQVFTATAIGSYAVEVTQGLCSGISMCVQITSLGITNTAAKGIVVYPNPVKNELNIDYFGNINKLDFEILNSIGQIVFKGNLFEKAIVPTSSFSPGVYLIKLENGKTFEFKKMIKE